MKFERVRLENFKCYESAELHLGDGVTVIHGLNGSGKSSLLEACFFALYGAKALEQNLEDIVTIGFDSCRVELWFTHAGEQYRIERELKERSGDVRTTTCVLEGPQRTTEGARDVRKRVATLLRMDAEAFVNCAYVRQGEVNKLINASPSERQDMLDELLQLGKLEEYRERASQARVGVGRVRDDKHGALNEVRDQIASKREAGLHEQLNEKQSELTSLESDIERHESNREEARDTLESARAILEEFSETQEQIQELENQGETLREKITEVEKEREDLGDSIDTTREKRQAAQETVFDIVADLDSISADSDDPDRETVESQLSAHREKIDAYTDEIRELSVEKQEYDSEIESLETRVRELEERAEKRRSEATELATDVESTEETLEEKRAELENMQRESEELRHSFSGEPVDCSEAADFLQRIRSERVNVRETIAEREAALENARERVTEAEELQAEGNCPECGQPVEGSPHVDALAERREAVKCIEAEIEELVEDRDGLSDRLETAQELVEREERVEELESNVQTVEQLLSEREATLEEKRERIESLREEATSVDEERETHLEAISELEENVEECREQIAACNAKKATLRERIDRLEELDSALTEIESYETELEMLRERREERANLNDERREHLAEKRERLGDLRESFDEDRAAEAREEKQRAAEYLEEVEEVLESLQERRDSLQGTIGAITTEIEELESLEDRADHLEASVDHLDSLYEETARLEEMYGRLRSELRQRNVSTLERMLNETFDLVYENDTYSRIELDGEYELTVFQKDGEALDPNQLSGGERALFNLSLRCAIYRLLGEGIEGAAPMPPLILDEPTVFLDAGHVSQLVELVSAMEDLGVEQILVVSHDDELVAAADDLVTVRKDATSNRSRIERTGSMLDGALTSAAE